MRTSAVWDGTGCKTAGQPQPAPLSTDCQFPACRSDNAFVGAPPAVRPQGAAHRKCFQASECRKRQFGGCFSDHAPPQTHQAAFDRFVEFQRIPTRPTKTNAYQRDQRQTNRIQKEIPVTPHALKAAEASRPKIVAAIIHMKAGDVRSECWSRRRRGPSRPRLRRAASRSTSLDRLAPS